MIAYILLYGAVNLITGLIIIGWAATKLNPKPKKPVPCDSCKHLWRKGGDGARNYYCVYGCEGISLASADSFNTPPEICGVYEPREAATQTEAKENVD